MDMPGAAPPPTDQPMPPPGPGGPTGPATTPPSNNGMKMKGIVMANLGMSALLKSVEFLPQGSEEKLVVLEALAKLERKFQGAARDLSQQEVKLLGATANPAQTSSPEQQLATQKQQGAAKLSRMAPAMAGAA